LATHYPVNDKVFVKVIMERMIMIVENLSLNLIKELGVRAYGGVKV